MGEHKLSDAAKRTFDERRLEKSTGTVPKVAPPVKNQSDHPTCMTCRFMWHVGNDPNDITKKIIECRWGPPAATVVMMQRGFANVTAPPQPAPDYWCHRHEPIEAQGIVAP